MEFRIADTFTGSLVRLTGAEQKAVKTTAFDLQLTSRVLVSAFIGSNGPASPISGQFVSTRIFA